MSLLDRPCATSPIGSSAPRGGRPPGLSAGAVAPETANAARGGRAERLFPAWLRSAGGQHAVRRQSGSAREQQSAEKRADGRFNQKGVADDGGEDECEEEGAEDERKQRHGKLPPVCPPRAPYRFVAAAVISVHRCERYFRTAIGCRKGMRFQSVESRRARPASCGSPAALLDPEMMRRIGSWPSATTRKTCQTPLPICARSARSRA